MDNETRAGIANAILDLVNDPSHPDDAKPARLMEFLTGLEAMVRNDVAQEAIPMLLFCPSCGERHIDRGEQATRIHRTHACQGCGVLWAPAVVPTVGVRFLPGCKDKPLALVSKSGEEKGNA